MHSVAVTDRRVARIVQRCQELPGQELFQYVDADGARQSVQAEDVNAYLHDIAGRDVTAKDFRTWAGTMLTAESLRTMGPAASARQAERNIVAAIDRTAAKLGNTRSVCRKYYIHPALLEAYREGDVLPPLPQSVWRERQPAVAPLRRHEAEVLAFLKTRLEGDRSPAVTGAA